MIRDYPGISFGDDDVRQILTLQRRHKRWVVGQPEHCLPRCGCSHDLDVDERLDHWLEQSVL